MSAFNAERFRDDLLAYMERQGITKSRLAIRAGLYPTSVSRILEAPNNTTPVGTIVALAAVADLSLDDYVVPEEVAAWA